MKTQSIELSEVILDIAAGPFGSNLKKECFQESGFPIVDGANLKGFKLTDNITKFVTEEKARSLHRSIAKRNDVVVTISGTLGQIAYIPMDSAYEEYLCSQRQFRVTFDTDRVYVPYLVFMFHTYEGQNKILSFANQVGVPALAQPLKNFRQIKVDLPDMDTQKKIANIIEVINGKIENNEAINRNLQEQAQAYFDELFDTNEGLDGTLSDVGTIVAGGTPSKARPEYYKENGIAWITPKDLSVDRSVFIYHGENDISDLGYSKSSATKMPEGTVLFSSRAPIGYIAIAGNEVTTNQGFKSVVPNEDVGTAYIYFLLKKLLPVIESMASGSTFKEISGSAMKMVPISIPDKDSLKDFNAFCMPLFEEIKRLELEAKRLSSLRDALLPKLMSGELDVSDIDI